MDSNPPPLFSILSAILFSPLCVLTRLGRGDRTVLMIPPATSQTFSILESLIESPLLVGDLPIATSFDRALLGRPCADMALNYEQKLGHLYEQALALLIDSAPSLKHLARNLQIFDESGRTIGELDFLIFDEGNDRHIHLELAVKFYLAIKTVDGWEFPGPDPRDNWQAKLDRMRDHQFALSRRAETQLLLKDRFDVERVIPQHLIYGCLFLPIDCDECSEPEAIVEGARKGRWLYISQWNDHFADIDHVLIIPKPLWPVEMSEDVQALLTSISVDDLKGMAQERCTMFTVDGACDIWFLVPDDWRPA